MHGSGKLVPTAAKCMAAAVNVFAGKGKVAIPTETVRALCKFFISFGRIAPCIDVCIR